MKISKGLILLLVASLFLTGCFDVIEVVTLNKKGGGTFRFELDLSKSKLFISDTSKHLSYTNNEPITTKLVRLFKGDENELEHINGISKVTSVEDKKNYLYGIKFEFENIWALNQALDRLEKSLDSTRDMSKQKVYFVHRKGVFSRVGAMDFEQDIKDHMEGDETDLSPFYGVNFTTIYNLPKKSKKVSNPNAKISNAGKTVKIQYYPFDRNQDYFVDNSIRY